MAINRGMKKLSIRRDADNAKTLVNIAKQYLPSRIITYHQYMRSAEIRIRKVLDDLYKIS